MGNAHLRLKNTYAELSKKIKIDEIICVDEIAGYLAVSAVVNPGMSAIIHEVFDYGKGNNMYTVPYKNICKQDDTCTIYLDLVVQLLNSGMSVLAVKNENGFIVNPAPDYILNANDSVIVFSRTVPSIKFGNEMPV